MTVVIWTVLAVVLATWTGLVWLATNLTQWAAGAVGAQTAHGLPELSTVMSQVPAWLSAWLPAEAISTLLTSLQWGVNVLEGSLPWAGTAVGALVWAAWAVWFVVAAALIIAAVVTHVLVKRLGAHAAPSAG